MTRRPTCFSTGLLVVAEAIKLPFGSFDDQPANDLGAHFETLVQGAVRARHHHSFTNLEFLLAGKTEAALGDVFTLCDFELAGKIGHQNRKLEGDPAVPSQVTAPGR